jgi:uncharacterized lipoprotein YddW (UPF0748 family)
LSVRIVSLAVAVAVVLSSSVAASRDTAAQPEFRAYWVDAFGDGIYTPAQIDKLVAAATAANVNALVVQVGRRGDCFCNRASMPRTQAAIDPLPYDPLDTLVAKAHMAGIEVHAWIITTAMWNSSVAPRDGSHAFNTHGPTATGYDNWLGVRYDGALRESASPSANWFFDPGHPDAADYMAEMYLSVARSYDIDGLNFDRVRYPDLPLASWPDDNAWGYNAVALDRFHAATGRSDRPLPNDAQWSQWRRDQITAVVRKVYVESYAIKPQLRISADTITYGDYAGDWTASRPYRETLQDWRGWMEEGILDLNIPMNYKREHCTATGPGCFGDQRAWYMRWNDFAKDHQYRRQTAIGPAIYLNTIANSVTQARKALAPSVSGNSGVGWVGYSYRTPDDLTNTGRRTGDLSRAELTRALTRPSEYDSVTPAVFAAPAAVPDMPWKSAPTRGHLAVTLTTTEGVPCDQILVQVRDRRTDALVASRLTGGNGYVAFVDLEPGTYRVFAADDARLGETGVANVRIAAGEVTRATLAVSAKGLEGKRQPRDTTQTYVPTEDPGVLDDPPNGWR